MIKILIWFWNCPLNPLQKPVSSENNLDKDCIQVAFTATTFDHWVYNSYQKTTASKASPHKSMDVITVATFLFF